MIRTVTARYVFPVSGPPLAGGLLSFAGDRIVAVEPPGTRPADEDFGNAAILPGLVNAHTHLDLSGARGLIPPTDPDHFTDWLKGVIAYRRERTAEQVQQDIREGLREVLQSGTTLVGDITSGGASYEALSGKAGGRRPPDGESQGDAVPPLSSIRARLFWELIGLTKPRLEISRKAMSKFWRQHRPPETLSPSVSPHAPYSVHRDAFSIRDKISVMATHLAESPQEIELVESQRGSMVDFLQDLGVWEGAEIVSYKSILKSIIGATLLAHCNYLPEKYWGALKRRHSVVYCPRTHAAFGHPPHPFREFLARGVRVCLGTDSLASNPDLDILAEARFVRSRYPDSPGEQLLKMITLSGAEALGWSDETGSLEPGKSADFVVVPLPNRDEPDPHDLFLNDDSPPSARRTMFRGRWRE